jgi:hypothetical protein
MMKSTDYRPLQEAPDAFNSVGMNVSPDKFILRVVDGLMPGVMVSDASISGPFVSENRFCLWRDMPESNFVEGLSGAVQRNLEYNFTPTLYHSHHEGLVAGALPDSYS